MSKILENCPDSRKEAIYLIEKCWDNYNCVSIPWIMRKIKCTEKMARYYFDEFYKARYEEVSK